MAGIKKGTITTPPSYCGWWKHMRHNGKRLYWKAERKAARAALSKVRSRP